MPVRPARRVRSLWSIQLHVHARAVTVVRTRSPSTSLRRPRRRSAAPGRTAPPRDRGLLHQALENVSRSEHPRALPPGSILLLYTDGLIERRDRDIDATIPQLSGLLARHGTGPLSELLRRISNRMADPPPEDDVVLLALRVP
ncbi:SpoIIE family protein phosphatase [Streptomyces sp. NPDC002467]|uniref:SpoIIE family protein phosphatase n=1 Tax=Streptomyces sp. NPDC002467 TaxID=3364647 RepID=UPI0036B08E93